MTIITETKTVEITLRKYVGGWNCGLEPDCLNDLEPYFLAEHEKNDDGYYVATDEEADNMISFWKSECVDANSGKDGEIINALTQDEIDRGDEWELFVEEK